MASKFQNICNKKGLQLKDKVRKGMHLKFHNKMECAAVGTTKHQHLADEGQ
jgi:hypothetical protein